MEQEPINIQKSIAVDIDIMRTTITDLLNHNRKIENELCAIRSNKEIDISLDKLAFYAKDLINKLLKIGIECHTDIEYRCIGTDIHMRITYWVSGNQITVEVDNKNIVYESFKYPLKELFNNSAKEKYLLYTIRSTIYTFYKVNL